MKQLHNSSLGTRAQSIVAKLSSILKTDYSFGDFNLAKSKKALELLLLSIFQKDSTALMNVDRDNLTQGIMSVLIRERTRLFFLAAVIAVVLIVVMVLIPYNRVLTDRLSLRPAQLAHLQNLIASSQSQSVPAREPLQFDDVQLQGLRSLLLSRDIKPLTLVISSRNPTKLEIKAKDVLFSSLLDVLEQMRTQWNIYPDELNIQATELPAVVSINGYLLQYRISDVPNSTGLVR